MDLAQIIVYGGIQRWIDVAQRKNPNVKWFIFIETDQKNIKPEYWEKLEVKIIQLQEFQKKFPESEKIKYSILVINSESDLVDLVRYFRGLIKKIHSYDYHIICNLTTGVFELRMALFLAAQIEVEYIDEIFYFNKQTLKKNILPQKIYISERGLSILRVLYDSYLIHVEEKEFNSVNDYEVSLSTLKLLLEKKKIHFDLPTLSRLINKLIKEEYLKYRREGREKLISLSSKGLTFCPLKDIQFDF